MLLWRRSITSAASVIIGFDFDHLERWHTHSRSWTNGNINNWLIVGIEFLWSYFMVCSKPQFDYKLLHIYFTFKFARHSDKMATAFNYSVVKIWKTSDLLNNDCRSLCFFFWHAIWLNGQSFVPALVRLFHDRFIFFMAPPRNNSKFSAIFGNWSCKNNFFSPATDQLNHKSTADTTFRFYQHKTI